MKAGWMVVAALVSAASFGLSQAAQPAQRISADDVKEKIAQSESKAKSAGSAGSEWGTYPNHAIRLSVRTKSGGAEVHKQYADIFIITGGEATLLSGGTVTDGKEKAPGEIVGTVIKDGTKQTMKVGDVIHVPAGTPHQTLVEPGITFSCIVIKVKEN